MCLYVLWVSGLRLLMVRVSYGMNVLNGEPFIEHQLRSIYPHAHEIVIVEGAYEKFAHAATADAHSTDKTVEIIRSFPDPDHKIKLIQKEGFWPDRLEMCNAFMPHVTGDVLWQVDADEFYLPNTHAIVGQMFEDDAQLDRVSFRVREFFASLRYELCGYATAMGLSDVRRVHRRRKGDRWLTQRPPTLSGEDGLAKPIRGEILAEETARQGHFLFHPTMLLEGQILDKYRYYRRLWSVIEDPEEWFASVWKRLENPLRLHGLTTYASWLERYAGSLPSELARLGADLEAGRLQPFRPRGNQDIEAYLASDDYRDDVELGKTLNLLQNLILERAALPALVALSRFLVFYLRHPLRITHWSSVGRFARFLFGRTRARISRDMKTLMNSSVQADSPGI